MNEWITAMLALLLPVMTLAGALCHRAGVKEGLAAAKSAPPAGQKTPPAPPVSDPPQGALQAAAEEEEAARFARILANIDAYDGTGAHQVDP